MLSSAAAVGSGPMTDGQSMSERGQEISGSSREGAYRQDRWPWALLGRHYQLNNTTSKQWRLAPVCHVQKVAGEAMERFLGIWVPAAKVKCG